MNETNKPTEPKPRPKLKRKMNAARATAAMLRRGAFRVPA